MLSRISALQNSFTVNTMQIKTYNCYNADTKIEINSNEIVKKLFDQIDSVLKYLMEVRPEIEKDYRAALKKRLIEVIGDFDVDSTLFGPKTIGGELKYLTEFPDLQELIMKFAWQNLALPNDYQPKSEIVEVTILNRAKTEERLSYHKVKAFVDLLGRDEGVQLYSGILGLIIKEEREREMNSKNESYTNPSILKSREASIRRWCKEGIADFTVAFDDDYKTFYRFDRCVTHEALKDLNDPDIAYICSCYAADIEEFHVGRLIEMRRTQTLHHGAFCDELYWDTRVHKDPKQPALEFTRNLGKT